MSKIKNEVIRVIPLGGVGEIGKAMYVIEIDEDLFVVDSGLMFPEDEMLGVDIVIPDMTFLEENKDRVKGIFLTHGHEDAIGSIAYLLKKIQAPVYGSKLTIALAKEHIKEQGSLKHVKFFEVTNKSRMNFDKTHVTFFHTTHSIPDAFGIVFHTSEGAIVHTGEFKFDQSAKGSYKPDIAKMAKLGEDGVLMLLSDSTEAERPGYTTSEIVVADHILSAFLAAEGRVLVSLYSSNFIRIQQVFDIAAATGKKVAVAGRSLESSYEVGLRLGYLTVDEDTVISLKDLENYRDDEVVIIVTGNQGEPLEALDKMVRKQHKDVKIKETDTVLITFTPSPGMEVPMFQTMNKLAKAGANVLTASKKVHVSGHGSQEDLKMMLNMMKPKYFIPIQGEYKMLIAHSKLAQQVGLHKSEIFIADKGDIVEYKEGKVRMSGRVTAGNVLIDGIGIGDVGNIVLRDRKLLSQDGIFIVVVTLNRKEKKIASGPEMISRGFVYVRESEELMDESTRLVRKVVEKYVTRDAFEWNNIKQEIRDTLNSYLFQQTKRRPMIIPIIMEY
ncbi:ribonuclease J [Microbacterium sp. APC 3898]|uniref:Ribonuclease J n=2 Tax=Planococcus TaxID=1372 RepID=A0ABT7ZHN1_9BACL|nr:MULTISPECIES: ribonuclease J [Terrabacteria group]MBF6634243.1 ribonuclease J [Planococcus sp. (in: firmicutes)]MBD8013937.1 ribonuclease J [Planococcus wigleyi]MDN3426177.1 ribonuclease J [Planococcus sp. APC 4016]MDN3437770.1 ribonuclease J [Planococcus sp. APC 3900]MDN3497874.1 ribonuclease J [Microbacterium sp. APC 3898]